MASGRALKQLWKDPERRIRTLESFSKTEEDGGHDLLAAARRVADPELKKSLEVHARDERRHAELFRRRASELRAQAGSTPSTGEDSMRAYDLTRGRAASDVDAHGFFTAGLCDELGDIAYVAMLHVAEQRAAKLFERHRDAVPDDAATRAIFEEILNDEKFHVSYTANFLTRWRKQGRAHEVKSALRRARGDRFLGGWKRFGARSAASFGRAVLWVMYWTLLLPFALFARNRRAPSGFKDGAAPTARALESQYA